MVDAKYNETKLNGYIEKVRSDFESKIAQAVEIPSISMQSEHAEDMKKNAELFRQYLADCGADARIVENIKNPNHPFVLGKFTVDRNAPTVIIYNHIDVQPPDPIEEWGDIEPFVYKKDGERYYSRGATDDKGPALTTLYAGKFAVENNIPLNIIYTWESGEEIGSPGFPEFLEANKDELNADSVVLSDTIWISDELPAIPYGLRGAAIAYLKLQTAEQNAHSGLTGGAARNPFGEIIKVISKCYDGETGEIFIPGFFDDAIPPTAEEVEEFASSGFSVENFKKEHELRSLRTDDLKEVVTRIWGAPTFEIHGMPGGYIGEGAQTIVPARAEAKVSMRLIPNQKPDSIFELFKNYVNSLNSDLEVIDGNGLGPYLGRRDGDYIQAAVKSIEFGFGKRPALIREGGSIGAVLNFSEGLGIQDIVMIGLSKPAHGYHKPREFYEWGQFAGGVRSLVDYFSRICDLPN